VILVATQADSACTDKVDCGVKSDPDILAAELQRHYETNLIIEPHLFIVDTSSMAGSEMTALRRLMAEIKEFICEVCPLLHTYVGDAA